MPRAEKVEYAWGGYHVKLDRVEWRIIPDPATAAGALVSGEVDWVEVPIPDLLPMLRKAAGVKVDRLDTHGVFPVLVNTIAGMRNVNPLFLKAAQAMGARRSDVLRDVVFPHMVGSFFTGLRLAMTMTLLASLRRGGRQQQIS